ncbi:hypothetical protein, partial [Chitinophaga sp.]|uniref:hypothetical protein n=1 Tax=Chitinophaga sp. TaxID=1869181 RepID=UPI0031D95A22
MGCGSREGGLFFWLTPVRRDGIDGNECLVMGCGGREGGLFFWLIFNTRIFDCFCLQAKAIFL